MLSQLGKTCEHRSGLKESRTVSATVYGEVRINATADQTLADGPRKHSDGCAQSARQQDSVPRTACSHSSRHGVRNRVLRLLAPSARLETWTIGIPCRHAQPNATVRRGEEDHND